MRRNSPLTCIELGRYKNYRIARPQNPFFRSADVPLAGFMLFSDGGTMLFTGGGNMEYTIV